MDHEAATSQTRSEPASTGSVVCVDDNPQMAAALRQLLVREGFEWKEWLQSADGLLESVALHRPSIVLLDLDMPGRDPIETLRDLAREQPDSRAVIFSGHVRRELVDRAIEAGAWGYVSKNDSVRELVSALHAVIAGRLGFSPEVR